MKSLLKHLAVFTLISGFLCTPTVMAQDTASTTPTAKASTVTPEDKAKLMKVRQQVLDSNPDLKTEQEALTKQREDLKSQGSSATPEARQAFMTSMAEHQKKMREAILKIDPTLGPVFDQMQAQMKQRMQQRAGGGA